MFVSYQKTELYIPPQRKKTRNTKTRTKLCCFRGLNIHLRLHHAHNVQFMLSLNACSLFISVGIASEAKDWYSWQQLKFEVIDSCND